MDQSPRRALRALAQRHGLSDRSLTLIQGAAFRLSDAQIRIVYDAVETCVLSGLTERDVARVIAQHRARAPEDWRASFWAERLALANDRERLALARERQAESAASAVAGAARGPGPSDASPQAPPVGPIGPQLPEPAPWRTPAEARGPAAAERAAPVAPIGPQPPDPPQERTAPVAPIPPQPPSELGTDRREPATDVTAERRPINHPARRAA